MDNKRPVKDMDVAREKFYAYIVENADAIEQAIGVKFIGRAVEGVIFQDMETGYADVMRVIAKQAGYDAEDAVDEYNEKQVAKENKAAEKALKVEKAKAKKEKEKAEQYQPPLTLCGSDVYCTNVYLATSGMTMSYHFLFAPNFQNIL